MPFLGLGLHIGDIDPDSILGPPIHDALRTEAGMFLNIEAGGILQLNLPPFLTTEADEIIESEASERILTQ
jgi:hypothetical protein